MGRIRKIKIILTKLHPKSMSNHNMICWSHKITWLTIGLSSIRRWIVSILSKLAEWCTPLNSSPMHLQQWIRAIQTPKMILHKVSFKTIKGIKVNIKISISKMRNLPVSHSPTKVIWSTIHKISAWPSYFIPCKTEMAIPLFRESVKKTKKAFMLCKLLARIRRRTILWFINKRINKRMRQMVNRFPTLQWLLQ